MKDEIGPHDSTTNRRQFFSTGVRCVAIGGLTSLVAFQHSKQRRLAGDPNCIRLNTCADCMEFSSGCRKDKANQFRSQLEA